MLTPVSTLRRGQSVRLLRVPATANLDLPAEAITQATTLAHTVTSVLPTGDGSYAEVALDGLPVFVLPVGDNVEVE